IQDLYSHSNMIRTTAQATNDRIPILPDDQFNAIELALRDPSIVIDASGHTVGGVPITSLILGSVDPLLGLPVGTCSCFDNYKHCDVNKDNGILCNDDKNNPDAGEEDGRTIPG